MGNSNKDLVNDTGQCKKCLASFGAECFAQAAFADEKETIAKGDKHSDDA